MTDTTTLRIDTVLDDAAQTATLLLSGSIDVTAATAFAPLHGAPPVGRQAVLDFAEVTRVNSMGLAQLMRLLEQWQGCGVGMQARHMNRTVSMLFKMTGMNRYFGDLAAGEPAAAPAVQSTLASLRPIASPTGQAAPASRPNLPPQLRRVVRGAPAPGGTAPAAAAPAPAAAPPGGKLTFTVSLQSNQQLTGWYYLNTLLQRELERPISLDIQQLDPSAAGHQALPSLVFARPFDACALMTRHGYLPIAQPSDDTDEVCIVVRQDDPRQALADFAGTRVVTAAEQSFVFLLGRFFCDEYGLDSAQLGYEFTGNEITALKALLNAQADMLFMLRRNYRQLAPLSRASTRALHDSETGMAYHMLLVHPEQRELAPRLTQALLALDRHDKGTQALQDLGMSGWTTPKDDEIRMLQMLYQRYVPA